jgi:dTDP-4-dehydrorhamnose reductase
MLKNILQSKKKTYKFFLLGSNGLLGSEFKKILPQKKTLTLAKSNAKIKSNLKDFQKLKKIFLKYKFKYVINCIAITDVNKCEKFSENCLRINAKLPKLLSELSIEHKFKLIQISTDHLYTGKINKNNKESFSLHTVNNYARSKLISENYVKINKKNLVIRTNFTGFRKKIKSTFVGLIYYSILRKKKIKLYTDMYRSTLDVRTCAKLITKLIIKNAQGIYNCGTSLPLSKSEFAIYFAKQMNKKLNYEKTSLDVNGVKRAKYQGLDVNKIEKKLGIKMINPYKAIKNLTNRLPTLK